MKKRGKLPFWYFLGIVSLPSVLLIPVGLINIIPFLVTTVKWQFLIGLLFFPSGITFSMAISNILALI